MPRPKNTPKTHRDAVASRRSKKTKTERVDEVLFRAMETDGGAEVEKLIGNLNPDEQALFHELLSSMRSADNSGINLQDLWKVDYVMRPPTIEDFIEDPYWLGDTLLPSEESEGLWPVWRKTLTDDFDLDSRIHNVVITGSLGGGKSYNMTIIFLYRIALARLLRNPQFFLGLAKGSKIFYVMLSLSKQVVSDTVFGDAQNFMSRSAFFLEECNFNPDLQYSNLRINLGNNIFLSAGSKGWHIIGRNTMGVCLDEGNWRLEANPDTKAYELYDEVRTRIKNRFQKQAGFLPAISLLSSSARDESSFTEKVIGDIEKGNDREQERIYRFAMFVAARHKLKLQKEWFKVAYGLRNIEPTLLTGWYLENGTPIVHLGVKEHEEPPKGSKTVLIPGDYFTEFKRRVKTALQSIAGVSTGASNRFFSSTVELEKSIDLGTASGLENPSTTEMIPLSQEDDREIWDFLDHKKFLIRRNSRIMPRRHPEAPRFAHIDLATTSLAGLSICHVVGQQLVEGLIRDGKPFDEYRTVIEYDFILTIMAGSTKPISIEKVQKFFFWLRDYCNFHFNMITADQYQSDTSVQMLESRGFTTGKLSLVRTKIPLCAWRTAFEDSRVRMYRQNQLMRECEELLDGDKVEHPPNGSDDTVHGAAGAFFNAHTSGYVGQGPISSIPVMAGDNLEIPAHVDPFKPLEQAREPLVFGG